MVKHRSFWDSLDDYADTADNALTWGGLGLGTGALVAGSTGIGAPVAAVLGAGSEATNLLAIPVDTYQALRGAYNGYKQGGIRGAITNEDFQHNLGEVGLDLIGGKVVKKVANVAGSAFKTPKTYKVVRTTTNRRGHPISTSRQITLNQKNVTNAVRNTGNATVDIVNAYNHSQYDKNKRQKEIDRLRQQVNQSDATRVSKPKYRVVYTRK